MFKLNEIKELVRLIDKSKLQEFEIEHEGTRLYISKPKAESQPVQQSTASLAQPTVAPTVVSQQSGAAAPSPVSGESAAQPVNDDQQGYVQITSPMVGTFYAAPSPTADPFTKKGDRITENTVVCIIEAMKLMNEIEAEVNGEIVEVLVDNAQLVEYGQPLFLVKPE